MHSNNGHSLCTRVTICNNSSIIPPGFKFTQLHTLTLATCSYALLRWEIGESEKAAVALNLTPRNCQLSLFKPLCFFIDTIWNNICVTYCVILVSYSDPSSTLKEDLGTRLVSYIPVILVIASFPGPAQLSVTSVLQATESWAGPGNEASWSYISNFYSGAAYVYR